MTLNVKLPPALEKFVQDNVAEGRFESASDVLSSGLRLLQDQQARKTAFMDMLAGIEAEVDRGDVVTHDEMMAELDAIIEAAD